MLLDTYDDPPRRWPALLLGVLLGAVLASVALYYGLRTVLPLNAHSLFDTLLHRQTEVRTPLPTVIASIQRLQRLETIVYNTDTVVEGLRTSQYLPDLLFGDKLVLLVHGQSIAGIDLGQIDAKDIRVDGNGGIAVHLPPPQIFVTSLDNTRTKVYSRSTGLFVEADPNLETEVRERAESEIRDAAISGGILKSATANAQTTLTTLLNSLGFSTVSFS